MNRLLQRIPPETKVAALVLGAALLQVGLVGWLGLRMTDQQRSELERDLRDRAVRAQRAVVDAGTARLQELERAALREIERAGRPVDVRIADALARGAPYSDAFVVVADPDGVPRLHDAALRPLYPAPPTPRDDDARRALREVQALETTDPGRAVTAAEAIAAQTGDSVAAALALQSGVRAALHDARETRALQIAERLLAEHGLVVDDRGPEGETVPFGLSASAAICEVRRRAVERTGFEHGDAFVAAISDRRRRAFRMRDLLGPAAYAVEREQCRELVEGVRLSLPNDRTLRLRTFLTEFDARDARLDLARQVAGDDIVAALSVPGAARVARGGALLAFQPIHDEAAAGVLAVVLEASREDLWQEALAPLRHHPDLPEGVALVAVDDDGAALPGQSLPDRPEAAAALAEAAAFGPEAPGLRLAVLLADPAVLDRQTAEARRLWLWILGASVLAVIAASLLALRSVMREVRLARMKGDFVSNLSHELRTPLTSLRMFVETLQEGRVRDEDERRQCLDFIAQETDRLATLVDRVLQFAAFSRGRAPIELRSADPADVVRRALTIFQSRGPRAGVRVESRFAEDLPEVLLDRDAMIQVFLNLLDNAVKYGGENGTQIRVTVRGDGPRVRIEVEDDGPGVPERERELVFEEFYRGDESLSSRVQGAGIGLALCRRIVLGHGGRIGVTNGRTLGGACFGVVLPEAAVGRRIAVATQEGRN